MPTHDRRTFTKLAGSLLGGIAAGTTVTAAERRDRFIVSTTDGGIPSGVDVVHELPGLEYAVVSGREPAVRRATTEYAPDVTVRLDEPTPAATPTLDESDYEGQPGDFLQWDKSALDVTQAHQTTRGAGSRVAVIDSGILETHPDLSGRLNLDLSRNFTGDGGDHNPVAGDDHGTHVAGIVAADNGGGLGVNGVAPETELVDCRVFSRSGASFADIVAAVAYSARIGADVANLSLGSYPIPREGLGSFYGGVLNSVMTYANSQGTLLVVAAGNSGADLQHDRNLVSLPNEAAQAVSVAATGPIGYGWDTEAVRGRVDAAPPESPASYTNYGTNAITLAAPGGDASASAVGTGVPWYYDLVFNTTFSYVDADGDGRPDTQVPGYGWKAGTSMAAPNVAGAAALVTSANPSYNANQVEAALKRAASVPSGRDTAYYGSGFLNVLDAL